MSKEQNNNPGNLPSLAELHQEPELAFKQDKLNQLLWQPPPAKWVKKHPLVTVKNKEGKNVPLEYLPVDKVKLLLTRVFQEWDHEITGVYQIFQSVCVTVRLHYRNPVTGEMRYKDGIGAVGMQTDSGAAASDMACIKGDAVMKGAPAAESYALKNAAEKIGKLFGAGLGKWEFADLKGSYSRPDDDKEQSKPSEPTTDFKAPPAPEFEL